MVFFSYALVDDLIVCYHLSVEDSVRVPDWRLRWLSFELHVQLALGCGVLAWLLEALLPKFLIQYLYFLLFPTNFVLILDLLVFNLIEGVENFLLFFCVLFFIFLHFQL